MSRADAIARSLACYDDEAEDGYYPRLADLVSVPSESQNPERVAELGDYLTGHISPAFERLGYSSKICDNPYKGCGPVFLATRIEDERLANMLGYGHGDVISGMEGQWEDERSPWSLSFEDERVYGRGTAGLRAFRRRADNGPTTGVPRPA